MNEHNNYGRAYFVWQHVFWGAIASYFFRLTCFRCIGHLTDSQSSLIFFGVMIVGGVAGVAFNYHGHRNDLSVAIDLLIPMDLYMLLTYGVHMKKTILISVIVFVLSVFVYVYLLQRKPIRSLARIKEIKKLRMLQAGRMIRALAAICFSLPIAVFTISILLGHSPITSNVSAKSNATWEKQYTINENIEQVETIFDGSWDKLSLYERMEVMQTIANIEQNYLGLPHELNVESGNLGDSTVAEYNHDRHRIVLDVDELLSSSGEEVLNSLCHECYHAYQRAQVEAYSQVDDDLKNLRMFILIPEYEADFANYDGSDSFSYYMQTVEIAARQYAEDAVEDYKIQIEAEPS